jgi:ADP-ribose pyrophosphatase YjhB (NUDIX family)
LQGEWSIPGGALELGESIAGGVRRELLEETGVEVRVRDVIEVFDRIFRDAEAKIQFHFVIVDYLCEWAGGEPHAGSDVSDTAWVREDELGNYSLTETATRVIRKAFRMAATLKSTKSQQSLEVDRTSNPQSPAAATGKPPKRRSRDAKS